MPNSRNSQKSRKKMRYSSDSSDSERARSRRNREKSKLSTNRRTVNKKSRHSSTSSSSSSSSSRNRSSRSSSSSEHTASRASTKNFDQVTKKFEINDLYKDENKAKVISAIESDSFKQESFQSKKLSVNLAKGEIVKTPIGLATTTTEESLIHPNFLGDNEIKVEKWIKKLHLYRNS